MKRYDAMVKEKKHVYSRWGLPQVVYVSKRVHTYANDEEEAQAKLNAIYEDVKIVTSEVQS